MRRTQSPFTRLSLLIVALAITTLLLLTQPHHTHSATPSTATTTTTPPALTTLTILRPASLTLNPPFNPTTHAYILRTPTQLPAFSLHATTAATNAIQLRLNDGPYFQLSVGEREEVELLEGINHVFVQCVDEETREVVSYLITVCNGVDCQTSPPEATPSVQLLSLVIPNVNLTPAFHPTTFTYTAHTTRHTHGVIVVPTLLQPAKQLVVSSLNGEVFTAIQPTQRSHAQPMRMGINFLFVQVRDDAAQLATYSFVIERASDSGHKKSKEERSDEIEYIGGLAYIRIKEASAELTSLISSAGLLTPRFAPELKGYSLSVDHHTPSMTLTAGTKDTEATMALEYTWSTSSSPQPTKLPLHSKMMSAPIELCVGKTTIRVTVTSYDAKLSGVYSLVVHRESEAEESEGVGELQTSHSSARKHDKHSAHHAKPTSGAHADPVLLGVRGQHYSVHVEAGHVYNLITEPHLLVNARYVELSVLDERGKPTGETALGIAEIGLKTRTGHQLYLQTGAGEKEVVGFARVSLNQQTMNVDDQAHIDNAEESTHEDSSSPATHSNTELLAYNNTHTFTILTPTWYLTLLDTPKGITPKAALHRPVDIAAHGLIGQTWREKRVGRLHEHGEMGRGGVGAVREEGQEGSMAVLEGSMEDYRVKDGALYSSLCEFNLYESEGGEIVDDDS